MSAADPTAAALGPSAPLGLPAGQPPPRPGLQGGEPPQHLYPLSPLVWNGLPALTMARLGDRYVYLPLQ